MVNIRDPVDLGEISLEDMGRWWSRVVFVEGCDCWMWAGGRTNRGYGLLWLKEYGGMALAHRIGFTIFRGRIPPGAVVMHTCDNPGCVNPRHGSTGSCRENVWDKIEKGRHRGCVEVVNECPF